jgi:MSHA pilin protein MshC
LLISAHRSAGFSLIELVITVVILGILAAIAIPRLVDNRAFEERGFAQEVGTLARLARSTALASGCATQINLIATGVTIMQQPALAGTCNVSSGSFTTPLSLPGGASADRAAPTGVVVAATTRWRFQPDGTVQVSGAARMDIGAQQLAVDVGSGLVTGP